MMSLMASFCVVLFPFSHKMSWMRSGALIPTFEGSLAGMSLIASFCGFLFPTRCLR